MATDATNFLASLQLNGFTDPLRKYLKIIGQGCLSFFFIIRVHRLGFVVTGTDKPFIFGAFSWCHAYWLQPGGRINCHSTTTKTAQWRWSFCGIVGPHWVITAAAGTDKPSIFWRLRGGTLAYANLGVVIMVRGPQLGRKNDRAMTAVKWGYRRAKSSNNCGHLKW